MPGITELRADVDKLNTDIYFGDGQDNLPVVTRLALLEDRMKKFDKLFWAIIVMMLAVIGDLIKHNQ